MNLRSFYHLIALVLLFKAALLIYYYVYLSLAPSKDESRNSGFFEEHKSPTNLTNPLVNVYLEESFQPSFLLHNRNVKNIQSTNSHIMTSSIYSSKPASINVFRPVSCSALFNGDQSELKYSFTYLQQYSKRSRSAAEYSQLECSYLLSGGRYVLWPTSPEEDAFPIAFSIVTYRDIEQFERLLRAVYRPSNLICVHVDSKASDELWSSVNKIAECLNARYNNVIVTKNRVHPEWGRYSVLEADLNCMRDLHNARDRRKWHYFINLTGQEFPLRTNLELVRILSILNGANLMEAQNSAGRNRLSSPEKVPSGVHMYKGSVHIVASAAFVEFALNDSRAVKLLAYIRDHTYVPDEWFFSTLNHNPDALPAPGAYLEASKGALVNTDGPEEDMKISNVKYPFLARMKNWGSHPCRGKWLRQICIWGHADLPYLRTKRHLFVNKLFWDYQPFALDCLEEWFWNRTIEDFAVGPYSPLPLPPSPAQVLALPANFADVWPPRQTTGINVEAARNASQRQAAPSRIELDFWRELRVVKNHL